MLPFAQSLIGTSFGKYRLDRVIGAGGMGVVFEARHHALGSVVAIKVIQPIVGDDDFSRRFLLEAQLLAGLKHPNIVEIHDVDVGPFELPYYVMERLTGLSVAQWLIQQHPHGAPLDQVLEIIGAAGSALAYAHDAQVIHRDLKPENIFLHDAHGRRVVKLLDFGIAKLLKADAQGARTATGAMIGTLSYASPEQLLGQEISPAVDQYALALTAAELLTGRGARDSAQAPLKLLREAAAALPESYLAPLPPAQRAAIARATEPLAADRFADVGAFLEALGAPYLRSTTAPQMNVAELNLPTALTPRAPTPAAMLHPTTPLPPTRSTQAPSEPAPASRKRAGFIAAGAVLLAVLGVGGWWLQRESPTTRGVAPINELERAPTTLARQIDSVSVPADAFNLLGLDRTGEQAILKARGRWLLVPTGGADRNALPFALAADESLLGYWPFVYLKREFGALAIQRGSALEAVSTRGGTREPVFDLSVLEPLSGVAPAERVLLDDEQGTLVLRQPRGLEIYSLLAGQPERRADIALDAPTRGSYKLSRRHLVVAEPNRRLRVFRIADGATVLDVRSDSSDVRDIALLDDPGYLAVRDQAKSVAIYTLAPPALATRIAVSEDASPLLWLPDKPSLLFRSSAGFQRWRPGISAAERAQDAPAQGLSAGGATDALIATFSDVDAGVLALQSRASVLETFAWGDTPIHASGPLLSARYGTKWVDEKSGRVFIGDDQGRIERSDGERTDQVKLHDSQLRALSMVNGELLSAAERGEIAAIDPDTLEIKRQGRISVCEITPGVISFAPARAELWTVCGDSSVRRIDAVSLAELERIDAPATDVEFLKIAVAADLNHVVLSTLNRALVVLKREADGRWATRRYPLPSERAISFKSLDALDVLVFRGFNANRLWAFDALRDELLEIPATFGVTIFGLDVATGSGFSTSARGVLFRYELARRADGTLEYTVRGDIRTDLFGFQAHQVSSRGELWVAAPQNNGSTRLQRLELSALSQDVLARGELHPFRDASAKQ
jgi:serine/threonine protein kinase